MKNSEKQNLPENKKRFSGRRKIITAATLAVGLTACDPVPNDKIILNQDDKSVAVSYKYNFGWAESWTNVDYNIFVYKRWDKYEWTIEKRTDWLFSEKIQIESNKIVNIKSDKKIIISRDENYVQLYSDDNFCIYERLKGI